MLPTRPEPPPLDAPPEDFPPDDHPPQRWTPDGHWADDPLSERDYHHALTALDDHDADAARTERLAQLGVPRDHPDANTRHAINAHEPPPF